MRNKEKEKPMERIEKKMGACRKQEIRKKSAGERVCSSGARITEEETLNW